MASSTNDQPGDPTVPGDGTRPAAPSGGLLGRVWRVGKIVGWYGAFTAMGTAVQYLVVFPLLKREVEEVVFGQLVLAMGFVTLCLKLVSEGQASTIFRFHSWREESAQQTLLTTGLWLTIGSSVVVGFGLLVGTWCLPDLFGDAGVVDITRWLLPMVLGGAVIKYLGAVLRIDQRIVLSAALQNIQPAMMVVALALVPLMGTLGIPLGISLSSLMAALAMVLVIHRLGTITRWFCVSREATRVFLVTSPVYIGAAVADTVVSVSGRWFVSYYTHDMGQVTYYTVATWFAQMVRMPLDLASFALIPMICARKNLADFGRSTLMYFLGFLAALAPLIFLAGWFIGRPLMILYGKDTLAEASDMLCVVLGGKSVQVIYVLALGFLYKFWTPRTMMILSVLALMVNFGASFWLVPQHGAIGAAWANAIACAFQGIVALGLMLHRFHGSTKPGGGSPVAASGA